MATEYECQVENKTFYFRMVTFNRSYVSIQAIDKPGGEPLIAFPKVIGLVTWVDDNCFDAVQNTDGRYVVPFGTKYEIIYLPTDTTLITIEPVNVMRVRGEKSNKRIKVTTSLISEPDSKSDLEFTSKYILQF